MNQGIGAELNGWVICLVCARQWVQFLTLKWVRGKKGQYLNIYVSKYTEQTTKHMKRCSVSLVIWGMEFKVQLDITPHSQDGCNLKEKVASVSTEVGKWDPSYTADEKANSTDRFVWQFISTSDINNDSASASDSTRRERPRKLKRCSPQKLVHEGSPRNYW